MEPNVKATRKNWHDAQRRLDRAIRQFEAARIEYEQATVAANYAAQYLQEAEQNNTIESDTLT